MNLVDRVKNILITPKTEWEVIKNEQSSTADLFTKFAMILAIIPVLATFIGQSVIGISLGPFGSYKIPITNGLIYAVIYYIGSIIRFYKKHGCIVKSCSLFLHSSLDCRNFWCYSGTCNFRNCWIVFTLSNVFRIKDCKRYTAG